jgi:hypothetical protein
MSELLVVKREIIEPLRCWHFDTCDEDKALAELSEFLNRCHPSAGIITARLGKKGGLSISDENGHLRLVAYFDDYVFFVHQYPDVRMYHHFRSWEAMRLFVRSAAYFDRHYKVVE